ncbi:LytTR family DNA-binding domain-containing protein [candidate division KSB1 bacterium]|nr:LytTR family DNA-binding domain-containing protein [candidate division KSB1 bacterium]
MQGIHILIADDEQPARRKIRSFLKEDIGVDSVLEAANGLEAVKLIQENKPHLVFLDIQMPGMNGFEVIETVGIENMPAVVFVTAYDQYALEAFEVQAVDYLLKPFDQERFRKSFNRAVEQIRLKSENAAIFQKLLGEINREKKYLKRIMVNAGSRLFFVKTGDIMCISSDEKYVKLHTEKETYLIRETMNSMEARLDPAKFARIHRSYLVNLDFIQEMQPWSHGDYVIILKNGAKLTASRRFRDRLIGRF